MVPIKKEMGNRVLDISTARGSTVHEREGQGGWRDTRLYLALVKIDLLGVESDFRKDWKEELLPVLAWHSPIVNRPSHVLVCSIGRLLQITCGFFLGRAILQGRLNRDQPDKVLSIWKDFRHAVHKRLGYFVHT